MPILPSFLYYRSKKYVCEISQKKLKMLAYRLLIY